jgi:hypothetical protein
MAIAGSWTRKYFLPAAVTVDCLERIGEAEVLDRKRAKLRLIVAALQSMTGFKG